MVTQVAATAPGIAGEYFIYRFGYVFSIAFPPHLTFNLNCPNYIWTDAKVETLVDWIRKLYIGL